MKNQKNEWLLINKVHIIHISKPVSTITTYPNKSLQKVHIYTKNKGGKHTQILHENVKYVLYAEIG